VRCYQQSYNSLLSLSDTCDGLTARCARLVELGVVRADIALGVNIGELMVAVFE
jgi:hypothetical protein